MGNKHYNYSIFLFILATISFAPIMKLHRLVTNKNTDPRILSERISDAPRSVLRRSLEHSNTSFSNSSFLFIESHKTNKNEESKFQIIEQNKSKSLSTITDHLIKTSSFNAKNVNVNIKPTSQLNSTKIPQWMNNYFDWHRKQRLLINQANDMDDEVIAGVKYLIVECRASARQCGGTADRLKPILYLLLYANRTKRVLLIHWERPCKLENFFVPGEMGIDWRTPDWLARRLPNGIDVYSTGSGDQKVNSNEQILTARFQTWDAGMNYYNEHGESDFDTVFGEVFRTLFVPAPKLGQIINQKMSKLGLVPGEYVSAHVRARYPNQRKERQVVDKNGGLQFTGNIRRKIITIATNAINCAYALMPGSPIYFASDSHDAVNYITSESPFVNSSLVNISSLDHEFEPLHLDTPAWANYTPADFYPAFLDLWVMGMSRCTTFGMGGFGKFSNLLSYDSFCVLKHRNFKHTIKECPSILSPHQFNAKEEISWYNAKGKKH